MNKSNIKKTKLQTNLIKRSTSDNLTSYAGALDLLQYIQELKIPKLFDKYFPTPNTSATKFTNTQILLSVCLALLCDTHRLSNIEKFTADPLILHILNLPKSIDEDTLAYRLKKLGKRDAIILSEILFKLNGSLPNREHLQNMIIDIDSTVESTYGNQSGAAKGYNPIHKGLNSYHPNIAFCSNLKLVLGSWFRTGSAYTSNGTNDLINQIMPNIPQNFKNILFRMDCGYFNQDILSNIESKGYNYLVKVKIRNFTSILKEMNWTKYDSNLSFCKFTYKCKSWDKTRIFIGVRRLVKVHKFNFMNAKTYKFMEYEYCALCTSLDLEPIKIYHLYNKRGECENWIENIKHQFHGCHTLTNDFWINDILWQLSTLAYNVSVAMRFEVGIEYWREEHKTFFRWFICVPGKLIRTGRSVILKGSKKYQFIEKYQNFKFLQQECKLVT